MPETQPRASVLPYWKACPSFESAPEVGEAAHRGTVMHKYCEWRVNKKPLAAAEAAANVEAKKLNVDPIDQDEMESCEWAVQEIFDQMNFIKTNGVLTEKNFFWYAKEDDFEPVFGGHADVILPEGGYVFDFKSGKARDYEPQFAAYASMACQMYGWERATVVALYLKTRKKHGVVFEAHAAHEIVAGILKERADKKRPRTPCQYCSWCAEQLFCPALRGSAEEVASNREDWKLKTYHGSQIETPEEMGRALKLARLLAPWCESVEHHAKEMQVKKGMTPAGFKARTRKGNRTIKDTATAFTLSGMEAQEFLRCCNAAVGRLEKALGKKVVAEKLDSVIQAGSDQVLLVEEKDEDA